MGQQQLLLIALGVILVGVAVVLGIQYFGVGAEQGAKDELVAHCMTVGANAQQWFNKPTAMGGGGLSFTGFGTYYDANMGSLKYSTNGDYVITSAAGNTAVITGTPKLADYKWTVVCTVLPDSMYTAIQ